MYIFWINIDMLENILKLKLFILWTCFMTIIMWSCTYYSLNAERDFNNAKQNSIKHDFLQSGYLIKTPKCQIPEMYLNGPGIDAYTTSNIKLNCASSWKYGNTLPIVTSNLTALIFNTSALAILGIHTGDPALKCHYSSVKRPMPTNDRNETKYIDKKVIVGQKTYFNNNISVSEEMVEVICSLNETIIYWDYHIFIRPTPKVKPREDGDVSVFILGLDSVSRLNFHRHMPKSNDYLFQLGNIEMLGYNKVEDNTFPNLIPVLSGLSVEELRKKCWPNNSDVFDDCKFVWDNFKDANFSTSFVEDSPKLGMFNYLKYGFFKQPTDQYLRPVMLEAEKKIGHDHRLNTEICVGAHLTMSKVLDYSLKIALSMTDHSHMGFFWSTSLTHDFVEYPRFGDDVLTEFFDNFNKSGELNNTILIMMSDHGMRWGSFRDTFQGGLEDRLPMLRFIIPEWFKITYPKAITNLKKNVHRLTTPYDLHETLLDLVDIKRLNDEAIDRRMQLNEFHRGTSLFLEISENKTCQTGGIPQHYCACHNERAIRSVDDVEVVQVANFLMKYINFKLSSYPLCSKLTLHKINKAMVESGRDSALVKDYEIQITTVPGYAEFEATIRQTNDEFKMVGTISRLNLYGDQSICVNEANMKLLCYCLHQK